MSDTEDQFVPNEELTQTQPQDATENTEVETEENEVEAE